MKNFENRCLVMVTSMFLKIIIILKCTYKFSSLRYSVIAVQTVNMGRYIDCVKQVRHTFSLSWKVTSL